MYDVSDIGPNNKEMAALILAVFIFLLVVFSAGYCVGLRDGKDVPGDGSGTEPITNQLEQAGTNISNATAGIEAAAGHADKVGAGISNAKESAAYIEGTANTSAELIRQCEQIISNIRRRGKT